MRTDPNALCESLCLPDNTLTPVGFILFISCVLSCKKKSLIMYTLITEVIIQLLKRHLFIIEETLFHCEVVSPSKHS